MPETNSAAKLSTIASSMPSARIPGAVSAIWTATSGGGSIVAAVLTGTCASQRRAASRSLTRRSRNARLGVMLVAEAHQALDVVELDSQRSAHSSRNHARASESLIVGRSRPSRIRWLRFSSTSASPG